MNFAAMRETERRLRRAVDERFDERELQPAYWFFHVFWELEDMGAVEDAYWQERTRIEHHRDLEWPGWRVDPRRARALVALWKAFRLAERMIRVGLPLRRPPTVPSPVRASSVPVTGTVVLRRDAAPPLAKWEALVANEPKAVQLVDRDPSVTFPSGDTSPSAYDLSLAGLCARAGWTAQEIVDLLYWNRLRRHRSHGERLHDRQWYQRTVDKAMNGRNG